MCQNFGYQVGAFEDVRTANDEQNAIWRTLDQPASGLEHADASSFGSYERAGEVEMIFG
jgi:hypothetical protein